MNARRTALPGTQRNELVRLHAQLSEDTRSLTLAERHRLAQAFAASQTLWLERLERLVEPALADDRFPAFLLETPPFAELRHAIGNTTDRRDLPIAVADALEHFVDAYRDYLRTTAGEEVFAEPATR